MSAFLYGQGRHSFALALESFRCTKKMFEWKVKSARAERIKAKTLRNERRFSVVGLDTTRPHVRYVSVRLFIDGYDKIK